MSDPRPDPDPTPRGPAGPGAAAPGWVGRLELDRPPRPGRGRILLALASLAVVAAILAWGLPRITGAPWPQILDVLTGAPWWAVGGVVVLGLVALLLEAATVRAAMPGSRYAAALRAHAAANAAGIALPGGGLLGPLLLGAMMSRSGLAASVVLTGLVAASIGELLVSSVLVPLLGLAAYALSTLGGGAAVDLPGGIWAAIAAIGGGGIVLALAALVLRRDVLAGLVGTAVGLLPGAGTDPDSSRSAAPDIVEIVLTERDRLLGLLARRAVALLLPLVAARAAQWLALLLALRALEVDVPLLLTLAIFALSRVLALVPLTPGGAGITEAVVAAALVAIGVAAGPAAAAVLLLALCTWVVPVVAGGATALLPARARRGGADDRA